MDAVGAAARVLPVLAGARAMPPPTRRAPALSAIRERLAEVGPEALVDEVAPGLHYGPGVLDEVVLVDSRRFSRSRCYLGTAIGGCVRFEYGALTLCGATSQSLRLTPYFVTPWGIGRFP